jgi:excisionase family DNA binding protein
MLKNAAVLAGDDGVITFRTGEAARLCNVSKRTMDRMVADGRIASVKVRGIRLVRRKTLEQFMRDHEVTPK